MRWTVWMLLTSLAATTALLMTTGCEAECSATLDCEPHTIPTSTTTTGTTTGMGGAGAGETGGGGAGGMGGGGGSG